MKFSYPGGSEWKGGLLAIGLMDHDAQWNWDVHAWAGITPMTYETVLGQLGLPTDDYFVTMTLNGREVRPGEAGWLVLHGFFLEVKLEPEDNLSLDFLFRTPSQPLSGTSDPLIAGEHQ